MGVLNEKLEEPKSFKKAMKFLGSMLLLLAALKAMFEFSECSNYDTVSSYFKTENSGYLNSGIIPGFQDEINSGVKQDSDYYIKDNKEKRSSDSNSNDHKKKSKSSSLLDKPGIRVLIAIGVFILLNMAAITIHHIIIKVSRSTNSYRNIERNISPF